MPGGLLTSAAIRIAGAALEFSARRAGRNVKVTQERLLLSILHANAGTEIGRRFSFSSISSAKEFHRRVPIMSYEDIAPLVSRMLAGEQHILTQEPLVMFNMTSGTSGSPKYIPVTKPSLRSTNHLALQWMYNILRDHPRVFSGQILGITGSAVSGQSPGGKPVGCASGMLYRYLPAFVAGKCVVPPAVFDVDDYELRYALIARLALACDISLIVTPNPATLLKIADVCSRRQEEIIRCVRDGLLWDPSVLEASCGAGGRMLLESACRHALHPEPERAYFLECAVRKNGLLLPGNCWPDLQAIGCWLGGSAGFHAGHLPALYGVNTPLRDLGLLASEGTISLPYRDRESSGLLAVKHAYFEFIPEDDTSSQAVVAAHEVELGKKYFLVLTTSGGLYRYAMNDLVEITGFSQQAPELRFIAKGQDMSSIVGEKMHPNHFQMAIAGAGEVLNCPVMQFRAVPDVRAQRYEIFLHPRSDRENDFWRLRFIPKLDRMLGEFNCEYRQKRLSDRLKAPLLHIMGKDWEAAVTAAEAGASSHRDVQQKWRHIMPVPHHEDRRHVVRSLEVEE